MVMHVIAILGGKKDGNTHNLLKFLEKKLNNHEITLEVINLYEKDIRDCKGCENCVLGLGCAIKDDMIEIMNKMINSDGIIIASPVYNNNVSGKLKSFIDKTVKWAHSPILTSKPYLGVTTTSSSGLNITLKFLTIVGVNWGAHPIGNIWASKRTTNMKKNNKILSHFIKVIHQDKREHRPTLNQIIQFETKKVLANTVFPNDFNHWKKNNWFSMPYYYECHINAFNRGIGQFFHWMFFKIMNNVMKKQEGKIGTKDYGKLIFD